MNAACIRSKDSGKANADSERGASGIPDGEVMNAMCIRPKGSGSENPVQAQALGGP